MYSQCVVCAAGKARRLKQAKEEAHAEVEAYRLEREREYKDHERTVKSPRVHNQDVYQGLNQG